MAKLKAVVSELERQVDDLNDERIRLLKKLRDSVGATALSGVAAEMAGVAAGTGEMAELADAVQRLTVDVADRDAQIEELERALLRLVGGQGAEVCTVRMMYAVQSRTERDRGAAPV